MGNSQTSGAYVQCPFAAYDEVCPFSNDPNHHDNYVHFKEVGVRFSLKVTDRKERCIVGDFPDERVRWLKQYSPTRELQEFLLRPSAEKSNRHISPVFDLPCKRFEYRYLYQESPDTWKYEHPATFNRVLKLNGDYRNKIAFVKDDVRIIAPFACDRPSNGTISFYMMLATKFTYPHALQA